MLPTVRANYVSYYQHYHKGYLQVQETPPEVPITGITPYSSSDTINLFSSARSCDQLSHFLLIDLIHIEDITTFSQ